MLIVVRPHFWKIWNEKRAVFPYPIRIPRNVQSQSQDHNWNQSQSQARKNGCDSPSWSHSSKTKSRNLLSKVVGYILNLSILNFKAGVLLRKKHATVLSTKLLFTYRAFGSQARHAGLRPAFQIGKLRGGYLLTLSTDWFAPTWIKSLFFSFQSL